MPKVHFKDVPEPDLKEGSDLTANCGAIIKNAQFAMKFDFDLGDIVDWNTLRVCQECLELEFDHRFIYGLISGQEARDANFGS
jgi:hypothetical protein